MLSSTERSYSPKPYDTIKQSIPAVIIELATQLKLVELPTSVQLPTSPASLPFDTNKIKINKDFPRVAAYAMGNDQFDIHEKIHTFLDKLELFLISANFKKKHTIYKQRCLQMVGQNLSEWTQDYLQIGDNEIALPFFTNNLAQNKKLSNKFNLPRHKATHLQLGNVINNKLYLHGIAFTESLGIPIRIKTIYDEGGNTLGGHYKDSNGKTKKYAIVGEDSITATSSLDHFDTREEVIQAFKQEYQVDEIVTVTQPGTYHLDLAMCIVGDKKVILNDAVSAHYLLQQFNINSKKQNRLIPPSKKTLQRKAAEDLVHTELVKNGFSVIRIPGNFIELKRTKYSPFKQEVITMNFFNMVLGTAPDSSKFIITLGFKDLFFKKHFEIYLDTILDKFKDIKWLILPYENSKKALERSGGISCLMRPIYTDSSNKESSI
tara:strand:- start:877 stop:2178 length:1302 start_codon:yes stop_codon:yes gene_type:complete